MSFAKSFLLIPKLKNHWWHRLFLIVCLLWFSFWTLLGMGSALSTVLVGNGSLWTFELTFDEKVEDAWDGEPRSDFEEGTLYYYAKNEFSLFGGGVSEFHKYESSKDFQWQDLPISYRSGFLIPLFIEYVFLIYSPNIIYRFILWGISFIIWDESWQKKLMTEDNG